MLELQNICFEREGRKILDDISLKLDSNKFIEFVEDIKHLDYDIDIMIEAKKKDEALFRLIRELKYKTNYKFIDDTTFEAK